MKVVAGVDWSEASFAAVEQLALLYQPAEVAIVHGVDLGWFQSPMVAQAVNLQGYDEFRQSMMDAGRRVVERARALLPADVPFVKTVCEVHHAASFIIEQAQALQADLVIVGTHDHSRLTELLVGSVSHHVLLRAGVSTLLVKGKARSVSRVLLAIEGRDDAARLRAWLTAHPFRTPVNVTVLAVTPPFHQMMEPHVVVGLQTLTEENVRRAEALVQDTAQALAGPHFATSTDVRIGDPVTTVCDAGKDYDLVVVGSHGRTGLDRFLLGSVSHGIVHRAATSVLVVR
jgi:nucleotide-binding universal stress UspA family protein